MIRNYFKIAWRNIIKNPFYAAMNIIGLSTGIVFTLLIGAYTWSELQVNRNLKNAGNQYIIQSKWKEANQGYELATLGPLAKTLRENYPDLVANYYRYDGITSNVSKGDKVFREGLQLCDSTMLNMYGFSLMHGNAASALAAPFTVVITIEKAMKYFGKTDVVGQTITIENFSGSKHDFMITGVMNEFSRNSVTHLVYDYPNGFFVSDINLVFFGRNMDWGNYSIASYVELQKGVQPKDLEKPIQYLVSQNAAPQIAKNMAPFLVPLKEYYLSANNGLVKKMLYTLSASALFILLMAIINFVNMSVSRSASRMREIGIRKVLGGMKRQLVFQFLTESVILVFFATLFALLLYLLTKTLFSNITGRPVPQLTEFPVWFIVFPGLLILLIGILAGIYPAFVLSSLKSVESLKGKLSSAKEKVWLRKSLVAFQFGTATIVFIGALVIASQINLFFSKDIGYNKDYIISAQLPRNWTPEGVRKMEQVRRQFAAMPELSNVTLSYEVPDGNNSGNISLYKQGTDSASGILSQLLQSDEYYTSTYNIPMAAGEFFGKPGAVTDSFGVVINEAAAKAYGWKNPQEAIGKQLMFGAGQPGANILGVTKDFHFGSMQNAIPPVTFLHVATTNQYRFFSFKIKPENMVNSLATLQKKWSLVLPGAPFEYTFMDETLNKLYRSEIQLKKAAYTATALSLIIVLLGVLGLISLSIQKRTKEIGIRKVLGSSVAGIITLFMNEFLQVVIIAGIVACPVAYFIMSRWLQGYTYRIDITVQPFLLSVCALGAVTALLICAQTIKAALLNPVKSLQTE